MDRNAKQQVMATVGAMKFAIIAAAFAVFTSACSVDTPAPPRSTAPSTATSAVASPPIGSDAVGTGAASVDARPPVCAAYATASKAVAVQSGRDPVLGQIALTNGAALLRESVPGASTPASRDVVTKAVALANAYRQAVAAAAGSGAGATDPAWQHALDAVNAADTAMQEACK